MREEELFKLPEGVTDRQLMEEFEAAEAEVEAEGGPRPDREGFKRLWKRLVNESGRTGV